MVMSFKSNAHTSESPSESLFNSIVKVGLVVGKNDKHQLQARGFEDLLNSVKVALDSPILHLGAVTIEIKSVNISIKNVLNSRKYTF